MTIPRKTLEIASFWDQELCLDCETIQPPDDDAPSDDDVRECLKCGSGNLLLCLTVLAIADLVETEEG